jgi:glycerol-3-phosphate O-acyltransferase
MPSDIEIRGLQDLARLSHALREAGDEGKGLKRELYKGLNRETKQVRKEMRDAIGPALPHRGGLADEVQRTTRFTMTVNSSAANIGVRIRARGKHAIRRMNNTGTFRHPVFGNRDVWVNQSAGVEKDFLDKPFEKSRPELRNAVLLTIARTRAQIYRSI